MMSASLHNLTLPAVTSGPDPLPALPSSQPACTWWLTGLSGSGKSTLAQVLVPMLRQQGRPACIVDGDQLRSGLSRDLGFSPEDRSESVRRAAEIARLLNQQGIAAVVAMISPMAAQRALARQLIGDSRFIEVHVRTPLSVCEQRDPKGLYARARRGEIPLFTGVSADYEVPEQPDLVIDTERLSVREACQQILARSISVPVAVRWRAH